MKYTDCAWITVICGWAISLPLAAVVAGPPPNQPYEWQSVTVKGNGFVNGISYSPVAKDVVFMNTDMGGAYRWDAGMKQWACMTDWARFDDAAAKSMGVETLAVDPTDAGRVYMSVGTYMSPTAIMHSADGGRSFERTDVPFKSNGNGSARNTGQRMTVDPNSPDLLYYATRVDGLWKSEDRGKGWRRVESFPVIGQNEGWGKNTGLLFVHADKASGARGTPSKTLYVGVFDSRAGENRIYRSTDAGATWAGAPRGQPTTQNLFPQRMAITPDGRAIYVTYASSTSYAGPWGVGSGKVFKVTDPAGDSPIWTDVTPPSDVAYSGVALDPTDASTIYVTEMGNYRPADRIWRSRDGGASWKVMTPNAHRDDASAPYVRDFKIHWLGDLQIDPFDRNVAMFTTGYGIYRTSDLTADEPTWAFFNDGFEQSAVLELASPFDGPVHLLSAIGDRDGYRHVDFTKTPEAGGFGRDNGLSRGTSRDIDIARLDGNQVVRLVDASPFVQYSTDNGVTWHWFSDPPAGAGRNGLVALSASGTRVAWATGRAEVYYAERSGPTWGEWKAAKRDADFPRNALVVAELARADTFYAVGEGSAFRSIDGGANWEKVADAAPRVSHLRAVPDRPGHLWGVGQGVGLWRSTDGGKAWTRVDSDAVPAAYVVALGAPKAPDAYPSLFVGGRIGNLSGVFRSDDEGISWTHITDDQHQYGFVTLIQGDPRVYGRVYLGTNGRGIVFGDIAAARE